jgi:hypothetical protein
MNYINFMNLASWKRQLLLITVLSFFLSPMVFAQVYTNKEVGKKNEKLADSLKKSEYPYVLPIWGQKATSKGYKLPYSAGLSVQYFWQISDLIIDNLEVGFNNGPKYNLDGLIKFDKAQASAQALTFRPDVWLLPFLNIYGIFGKAAASTDVGYGLWIPDSTGVQQEVFSAKSLVEFSTTTFGFGFTPTIGVGGGWLALDMNIAWTDVPQLYDPARSFVFGPRMGKTFKFKKPDRNISFWAGGFRINIKSGTEGSINLSEVLPVEDMGANIDQGMQKVADAQIQVDDWWAGLTPVEQNNPVNVAKYDKANDILLRAGEILNAADEALVNLSTSTVQYSMDKRPADKWNFIMGTQFQLNSHLMFRLEAGFLASRTQFMGGIQYRFGL